MSNTRHPSGLAALRDSVHATLLEAKEKHLQLDVRDPQGVSISTMHVCEGTEEEATLAAEWRERERQWFPTIFPQDPSNTRRWMQEGIRENPERILFFLRDPAGVPWGHVGLSAFQWNDPPSCEIDSILRGRTDVAQGAMTSVLHRLVSWTKEELGMPRIELRVFSENDRAIRLYRRIGFQPVRVIPLKLEEGHPVSMWKECSEAEAERHFLLMAHDPAIFHP